MSHATTNVLPSAYDFYFSIPYLSLPISQYFTYLIISVYGLRAGQKSWKV